LISQVLKHYLRWRVEREGKTLPKRPDPRAARAIMEANRLRGDDNTETVRSFHTHAVRDALELLYPQQDKHDIPSVWLPPLYTLWVLIWVVVGVMLGLNWVNPTHAPISNVVMLLLWGSASMGILLSIITAVEQLKFSVIISACTGLYLGALMGIHHWPMPALLAPQITADMLLETEVGIPKLANDVIYLALPRIAVMSYFLILCQGFIQPDRPWVARTPPQYYVFILCDFATAYTLQGWLMVSPWIEADASIARLLTTPALAAGWRVFEHYDTLFPLITTSGIIVDAFFYQLLALLCLMIFGGMAWLVAEGANITALRYGEMPDAKRFARGGQVTHPEAWRLSRKAGLIVAANSAFLPFIYFIDAILLVAYAAVTLLLSYTVHGSRDEPKVEKDT
jgi:hypothetical protein